MVEIPADLARSATSGRFRRGVVFRSLHDQLDDPQVDERFKFGVVLGLSQDPEVLFVLTTSKMAFYSSGRFEADILRISVGRYAFFPKDTIVNLRQVYPVPLATLETRYAKSHLTFEGELSTEDLAAIDAKVRVSRQIPLALKRRILP